MLILLFIMAVAFKGSSEGAGLLPDGPLIASLGGTLMFTPTLPSASPFEAVTWRFNNLNIIFYLPTSNTITPGYENRTTFFPSTASLELRNLTLDDSGQYYVDIIPGPLRGDTRLDVYEPVSNVAVTLQSSDLVEFNDSARLSCSSSGSSLSFLWMNGSSEVTASDRVQLTDGGSNLTVVNVSRYDQGTYRCHVSNPLSSETSDSVIISVSFGPENIKINLSPFEEHYGEGSNIYLTCSADSRPSAQFMWFLNGDRLSDTGPELRLMNIQMTQSGNYSCQAFNSKTLRYVTSQLSAISVLKNISGVSLTPSTDVIIEGNPVNLTCDASGSLLTRKWVKNGSDLILTDNMMLYEDNRVLSFNSVNRANTGEYFCKVSNPVSSGDAKDIVVVNYGPENVQITGEQKINVGEPIKLICSSESTPTATYTWMFNGSEIPAGSVEFSKEKAELSDSGNYTCEVWNNVTERRSSVMFELFVHEENSPPPLPPGPIAGIVIACLVIVAAAVGGGYYFYSKNKSGKGSSNMNASRAAGGARQNNATSGNEDLNYADVRFTKNPNSGAVQLEVGNTEYADVRVNRSQPAASSPPTYESHMQRAKRPAPQPAAHDH